jgi:hypothetical protein
VRCKAVNRLIKSKRLSDCAVYGLTHGLMIAARNAEHGAFAFEESIDL